MNSLDRSVAPLDTALRRRFRIIHLQPDLELLRSMALREAVAIADDDTRARYFDVARLTHDLLAAVNEHLAVRRGPDYRLGHSEFLPVLQSTTRPLDHLAAVVAEKLLPQLEDLLKGQPEALRSALGAANESLLFKSHSPKVDADDYGSATMWLEILPFRERLDDQTLFTALRAMADTARDDHWPPATADSDEDDDTTTDQD